MKLEIEPFGKGVAPSLFFSKAFLALLVSALALSVILWTASLAERSASALRSSWLIQVSTTSSVPTASIQVFSGDVDGGPAGRSDFFWSGPGTSAWKAEIGSGGAAFLSVPRSSSSSTFSARAVVGHVEVPMRVVPWSAKASSGEAAKAEAAGTAFFLLDPDEASLALAVSGFSSRGWAVALAAPLSAIAILGLLFSVRGLGAERLLPSSWSRPGSRFNDDSDGRPAAVCLAIFVLAWLFILFSLDDAYFLQDDNYVQFMPGMAAACSAMATLAFPSWSPDILGGAPLASIGTYAATYPLTWLSCALSATMDGPRRLIDVFAALHLIPGSIAAWFMARRLGASPTASLLASASFVSCGFFSVTGRSWYYVLPLALYLPLIVMACDGILRSRLHWRWSAALGVSTGLLFHAGNAQLWVYAMLFACALVMPVLWARRRSGRFDPIRRTIGFAGALFASLGIALPLLLVQAAEFSGSARTGQFGATLDGVFSAVFLPPALAFGDNPVKSPYTVWSDRIYDLAQYGSGSLAVSGWVVASLCLLWFIGRRRFGVLLLRNLPAAIAFGVFVLAMPRTFFVGVFLQMLPLFDQFQHSMKMLPFALLPAISWGCLLVSRLGASRSSSRSAIASATIASLALSLLTATTLDFSHLTMASNSLRPPSEDFVKAVVGARVGNGLRPGEESQPVRILPVVPQRVFSSTLSATSVHDFPHLFGIPSLSGYDPLVETTASQHAHTSALVEGTLPKNGIPLRDARVRAMLRSPEYLRAWGVGVVAFHDGMPEYAERYLSRNDESGAFLRFVGSVSAHSFRSPSDEATEAFRLALPSPLAGLSDGRDVEWSRSGSAVSLRFVPSSVVGAMTVALLDRPFLTFRAGFPDFSGYSPPLSKARDEFGRTVISIPPGAAAVEIGYEAPWGVGSFLGAVLLALSAFSLRFSKRSSLLTRGVG